MSHINAIIKHAFYDACKGLTPEQVADLSKHFGVEK